MSTTTSPAGATSSPADSAPACSTCNDAGTVDNVPYPIGAKNPTYHNGVPCWECSSTTYDRWVGRQMRGR